MPRLLGVVLAALAVAVVGVAAPAAALPTPGACASVAGTGGTRVALVVDYGDVAGSPGRVDTYCVTVSGRASGFDVLEAAGLSYRLAPSMLLCGIGGWPASPECGQSTPDGYRYWAYFRGTASGWEYRSIGPGSSYPADGAVEGWRFVQGSGNPSDPPPRHDARFASICAPAPTTIPTTAPAPTTTARSAAGPPTSTVPVPSTIAPGPATAVPDPAAGDGPTAAAPTGPAGSAPTVASDGAGTTASPSEDEQAGGAPVGAVSTVQDDDAGGGAGALGAVVGLGAAAVLGALAIARFRAGRDEVP